MRKSLVRIVIGIAVGAAGLMLLPPSSTRWPALGAWVVAWTFLVVLREARNERHLACEASARASLDATVAATERRA